MYRMQSGQAAIIQRSIDQSTPTLAQARSEVPSQAGSSQDHMGGVDPTEPPRGLPPRREFSAIKVAMQDQADIFLDWYRNTYENGRLRTLLDLERIAASFQGEKLVDEHIRQMCTKVFGVPNCG